MADEKTYTQADIDKIKSDSDARIEAMDKKVQEALDEAKRAKAEARKLKEIDPAEVERLESELDTLKAENAKLAKDAKDAVKAAETAAKALEAEQGAARTSRLNEEISGALSESGVVPSLVPALKALMEKDAKVDMVDGKYAVQIGDKPAREAIKAFLDSEDGKAFRAAPVNGGGGATGSSGGNPTGKTMTRAQYDETIKSGDLAAITAMNKSLATKDIAIVDEAA
jgi:hypothetical protein